MDCHILEKDQDFEEVMSILKVNPLFLGLSSSFLNEK